MTAVAFVWLSVLLFLDRHDKMALGCACNMLLGGTVCECGNSPAEEPAVHTRLIMRQTSIRKLLVDWDVAA